MLGGIHAATKGVCVGSLLVQFRQNLSLSVFYMVTWRCGQCGFGVVSVLALLAGVVSGHMEGLESLRLPGLVGWRHVSCPSCITSCSRLLQG